MKLRKPLQTLIIFEVISQYSNKIGINYSQNYNEVGFFIFGGGGGCQNLFKIIN